jgi:hypothetical protein
VTSDQPPSPERRATLEIGERKYLDEAQIRGQIGVFTDALRPRIREFLTNQCLKFWPFPGSADEKTQKFYRDLKIPIYNGKPSLLLHDLGALPNPNDETLFQGKTDNPFRILCNTSGSGKTRLLFEGLCRRWGFYFVVRQGSDLIGTTDLQNMITYMEQSAGWVRNIFKEKDPEKVLEANDRNEKIALRNVSKVFLTRWIVFDTFIQVARELNGGVLPADIQRDWLLFQILPITLDGNGLFPNAVQCLAGISPKMLTALSAEFSVKVLGSDFNYKDDSFYYVIDEAQAAGKKYMGAFSDGDGKIKRPVLRPIIQKTMDSVQISGDIVKVIISGTGFSLELFKTIITSNTGKDSLMWDVVHTTGDFFDKETQLTYISRYLPPSFLLSESGTYLQTRIYNWLRGRYVVIKVPGN